MTFSVLSVRRGPGSGRGATEGNGARPPALQDADGHWPNGALFPGNFDFDGPEAAEDAGQPWSATTWTLNTPRDFGLDLAPLAGTAERVAASSRWEYDDLPYWGGEVDCCINAFTLANGAWLGADVSGLANWFVDHRVADGCWNCEWGDGSTRSSFHSTLNSLNGLLSCEEATGGSDRLRAARRAGEEYLLERRAAADYFRAAALHDDTAPDPRLVDAIGAIRGARLPDGTWLQGPATPGVSGSTSTWNPDTPRSD